MVAPEAAAREMSDQTGGGKVGVLAGRERYGLQNEEVALAGSHHHLSGQPRIRVAQSGAGGAADRLRMVQAATDGALPFAMPERTSALRSIRCRRSSTIWCVTRQAEFLRPAEKRETMLVNLRNIFSRMEPTKQDMHTLHGVVMAIAEGRKGPAKGGVLDGEQATRLRALLADMGRARSVESGTVAGWRGCCGEIPPTPSACCGRR